MMPELDGVEVLRQLRTESDVYVIMLTAKADEVDKIIGLSVGADDYLDEAVQSPRAGRPHQGRAAAVARSGGG